MFGLIGGLILFIVGAVGSVGFYEIVINAIMQMDLVPEEYARIILNVLYILATGGGLTVIAGSLILVKVRRLGNWLIGIGAGISLISLLIRIFFLGPIIQYYISKAYEDVVYFFEGIKILGFEIGLVGIGVLLSFMATFEKYRWTIILGGMSLSSMLAGLSGDPEIFNTIKEALGIPAEYGVYVDYVVSFLLYIGSILLVTALLAGAGYIKLSKIVVVLCLVATVFTLISVLMDLSNIRNYFDIVALLQYIRTVCTIFVYAGGIYFIKKA